MRDDMQTPLTIMMGMVLLVIAMAVVNVASLLLVRAAGRAQEFSVRYALGATVGRFCGNFRRGPAAGRVRCGAGLLLAPQALHLLIHGLSGGSPDGGLPFTLTLDWRVLLFTLAVTVVASLLFSLAPMAQFQNPKLAEAMKQRAGTGVGRSLQFRRSCVALQIGFSLLLLVGAGLFVRTIENLRNVDAGS